MHRLMWWLLTHKPFKGWVKPRQASSRWNFTSVIFALFLFFIALAPSLFVFTNGGELMSPLVIIPLALGFFVLLFLVWFLLWCHEYPSDDPIKLLRKDIRKMNKDIVTAINRLGDTIREDKDNRNGK